MKPDIDPDKIVILSGAGISAESGLPTFRDNHGLWNSFSWQELASPKGWQENPAAVLDFYNERRRAAWNAQPNRAHHAIAALQEDFDVVVITQNVDELHERAGSENVLHVHGRIAYARGASPLSKKYRLEDAPISLGQLCGDGTQLRPDVVWFGEDIAYFEEAKAHLATAAKVLVVGTSLTVFPVASLVKAARGKAEKIFVALAHGKVPYGFTFHRGKATEIVPPITAAWQMQKKET